MPTLSRRNFLKLAASMVGVAVVPLAVEDPVADDWLLICDCSGGQIGKMTIEEFLASADPVFVTDCGDGRPDGFYRVVGVKKDGTIVIEQDGCLHWN